METLYASHHGFSREHKVAPYKTTLSVLSSPSANSASSFDSQDDLLPELWLESQDSANYSYSHAPVAPSMISSAPQFAGHGPHFAEFDHIQPFHSSCLLRDESLEYAQSLLPNSLLFPLTEFNDISAPTGHHTSPASVEPKPVECDVPAVNEKSRRSSASSHGKCRHGSASSSGGSGLLAKSQCKNLNTQLYKTELCASFMKSGTCPYGGKCQFAHGQDELKSVDRPSNWRSKPCANWARTGSCRYGKRCCFKHGD